MPTGVAKTYYWGFNAVGGPPAPSCLDYLDVTKREWRGSPDPKTSDPDPKDAQIQALEAKNLELQHEIEALRDQLKKIKNE